MQAMRVRLKRIVIDGELRLAVAHVVARGLPPEPGRPSVRVRVELALAPGETLAQLRRRARDEALRYLDVA